MAVKSNAKRTALKAKAAAAKKNKAGGTVHDKTWNYTQKETMRFPQLIKEINQLVLKSGIFWSEDMPKHLLFLIVQPVVQPTPRLCFPSWLS